MIDDELLRCPAADHGQISLATQLIHPLPSKQRCNLGSLGQYQNT